jgi:hypothetical protein
MKEKLAEDIDINMSDADFLIIAKMAHEKDITFNKMVEEILVDYLNKNE